jgi:hypothetical protein
LDGSLRMASCSRFSRASRSRACTVS